MQRVGVNGANGRMGKEILALLEHHESMELSFAKSRESIAGCVTKFPSLANIDVMIDFSSPDSCMDTLSWCLQHKVPIVIGTTGLNSEQINLIKQSAAIIPIVFSPNMSLSVNILFAISKLVAKSLPDAEVEIIESHHRNKKDAPSGTALKIGECVAEGRNVVFEEVANYARPRVAENIRPKDEIGFAVVRGGDIVGKHTTSFIMDGEELNLTSEVSNRKSFAAGALVAAKFISNKNNGYYSMLDVLGINV